VFALASFEMPGLVIWSSGLGQFWLLCQAKCCSICLVWLAECDLVWPNWLDRVTHVRVGMVTSLPMLA
jgi:hypothetical protein